MIGSNRVLVGFHGFTGFPHRLENLENENVHGKVMEHEKLAKSHTILLSVMEFYQFWPQNVPHL